MKSSLGEVTFEHATIDDKLVRVTAQVLFDRYGEPSLDIIELEDEEGKEVSWHSLNIKDRNEIQERSLTTVPQDELYDDYEDMS